MRGALGKTPLAPGEGVLIRPTWSIHTWFMSFPIDVVFLDRQMNVVDVVPGLAPFRAAWRRKARDVLELGAGECERLGIRPGDRLALVES
jgi:uncharacterized membrane protein (UPF0127 family)